MTYFKSSAAILALGCLAVPASADVTGKDVWTDFQKTAEANGYRFSTAPRIVGQDVLFGPVNIEFELPTNQTEFVASFDKLEFVSQADGTVDILMPAKVPFSMSLPDAGLDQTIELEGSQQFDGLSIEVSGAPDDMTYRYAATSTSVELGYDVATEAGFELNFGLEGLSGNTSVQQGAVQTSNMEIAQLTYQMKSSNPDEGFGIIGTYSDAVIASLGSFGGSIGMIDPITAIKNGLATSAVYSFGKSATNITVMDNGSPFNWTSSSTSSEMRSSTNKNGMMFNVTANGFDANATIPNFPVPLQLSANRLGVGGMYPLLASPDAQKFDTRIEISEAQLDEQVWSMFDPTGALPRDPINLNLDIYGTAILNVDLIQQDPEQFAAMSEQGLGTVESLNVNNLALSLLGAELSGVAQFVLDNSDLETWDGFPSPEGSADLKLTGLNRAIESLIAAGLLQQEQAMMPRMMLGMFARPVGEDAYETDVKMDAQGGLRVNGQRLR